MYWRALPLSFVSLSVVSALEYILYDKREEYHERLMKRDFIEITEGISVSTSAVGLTSTVVVDITYTYNISVLGYVVSPSFDLEAGDYGYTVVTEYDTAADLKENLDKWQFIHQADDGLRVLLTPDCSNLFTLLDPNDDSIITYDICYSINSLADDFTFPSSVETTAATTPEAVTAVGTSVYITSDLTTTTATVPCPICTGKPTVYYLYESSTVTDTVVVPCETKTGYPVTEPVGAIVKTESVIGTVTTTVDCGCTPIGLGAANSPFAKATEKTVATPSLKTGSSGEVFGLVPTSTGETTTLYKTVTTIAATETAAETATGTATGTATNAATTTTGTSTGTSSGSSSGSGSGSGSSPATLSTSATPSVLEGAAGFSRLNSGNMALFITFMSGVALFLF